VLLDEPDAFLDTRAVSRLASSLAIHGQTRLVAIAAHSLELASIGATIVDLAMNDGGGLIGRSGLY
jgi:ABC-type transport system involved in cytochrome bd biosynthesis fused ATPase/permease subunit